MSREPSLNCRRLRFALCEQFLKHRHHALRADASADSVDYALLIGLSFVLSAEPSEHGGPTDVDCRRSCLIATDVGENACQSHSNVSTLRLLHLLDAVTKNNVSDFVAEHSGELVHRGGTFDESAVHVHVATRYGEGVHFLAVNHIKAPAEVSAACMARDLVAEQVYVSVHFRITDNWQLGVDLLRILLAHLNFLLLGDSAGSQGYSQRQRRDNSFHVSSRGRLHAAYKGKSYSNPPPTGRLRLLTLARDLRRRKSREKQSLFVAEGVRAVEELLKSPLVIRGILMAPQLDGAPRGMILRKSIAERGIETSGVTELDFRSAAETESPQGVLAIAEIPSRTLGQVAGRDGLRILVLDAVQDPGNVGTILRTAAALGADATVALAGTVDFWNAKVIRGAMGASFHHHCMHVGFDELTGFLDAEGVELWGTGASGLPVDEVIAPPKLALAVGNEGAGLSSSVRDRVTQIVSLPISESIESLNVAVAAGILLYQLRK